MKIDKRKKMIALAAAVMLAFTGCAASALTVSESGSEAVAEAGEAATAVSKAEMFTERDLSGEYDESEAAVITLSGDTASVSAGSDAAEEAAAGVSIDGSTITISEEGVYIVSGTLSDGMIIVDADDSAKVQIVLKDASITSSTSAALYVRSADKVFVTLAEGTQNTLANGGTFTAIDSNNIDGAVFAKDDITFNGSGSLSVASPAGHGIVGKDDVKFAGGTYTITAARHGVQANDSVRVAESDITITADEKDGIHVSDNSDEENGEASDSYFYIADGSVTISAGDDGIHADAHAIIEGGSITVTQSYEGIEALIIDISGGDIDVKASDDGINAAGGSSNTSQTFGDDDWFGGRGFDEGGSDGEINISGGTVKVQAGGDGIDANGSVTISGGCTVIEGPTQGDTSVLDYNTTATITGGTFIGTGAIGMAENFTTAENQAVITVGSGNQSAGQTVTLKDSEGNTVAEVTPSLDYNVIYISTPDVQSGSTYTLTAGSYSESIEITESVYSSVSGGSGGGFGGRGQGDFSGNDGQGFPGDPGNGSGQSDMNGGFGGPEGGMGQRGPGGKGGHGGPGGRDGSGMNGQWNNGQNGSGGSSVNGSNGSQQDGLNDQGSLGRVFGSESDSVLG